MPDEIQKRFVRSFVTFLKGQVASNDMAADAQESVEVAIQCLQAAFDIEEEEQQEQQQTPLSSTANAPSEASGETGTVVSEGAAAGGEQSVPSSKKIDLYELFQSIYIENNTETKDLAESIKNQGNRLMEEGKYNEALLHYNRAIAFNPKNPIYYCNRAAAYIRLGDNERAVIDCKSALVYNSSYSKAYGRLGIAYSNLGKYEEAEQAYSKAIELEPNNQDYRNNLEVARSARNQTPAHYIPQLTAGLNVLMANPTIRNIFNSSNIDLDEMQGLSQNPIIRNAISQILSEIYGGIGGLDPANMGARPPGANPLGADTLQLLQSFASQLSSAASGARPPNSGNNNQNPGQQPPPPPPSSS